MRNPRNWCFWPEGDVGQATRSADRRSSAFDVADCFGVEGDRANTEHTELMDPGLRMLKHEMIPMTEDDPISDLEQFLFLARYHHELDYIADDADQGTDAQHYNRRRDPMEAQILHENGAKHAGHRHDRSARKVDAASQQHEGSPKAREPNDRPVEQQDRHVRDSEKVRRRQASHDQQNKNDDRDARFRGQPIGALCLFCFFLDRTHSACGWEVLSKLSDRLERRPEVKHLSIWRREGRRLEEYFAAANKATKPDKQAALAITSSAPNYRISSRDYAATN